MSDIQKKTDMMFISEQLKKLTLIMRDNQTTLDEIETISYEEKNHLGNISATLKTLLLVVSIMSALYAITVFNKWML